MTLVMDMWSDDMAVFRENKSYCSCIKEKDRKVSCLCGETDYEPVWKWDENMKTQSTIVSPDRLKVYFHKGYSTGNACIRGDTPLIANNDYYWEIKLMSSVYGTSMMIGIGTEHFNINQSNEQYCNLLGCDSESWGLTFNGSLYHNSKTKSYSLIAGFTMGSIIGVHLNMWTGTLEYYLNRIPLGIAFTGLKNKVLYPLISSTASYTVMKLIFAHSEPYSLSLLSAKLLSEKALTELPPGLKCFNKSFWWLFPKSSRLKHEKKFDFLPSLYTIDMLTDSDEDDENSADRNIFGHRTKRTYEPPSMHNSFRPEGPSEGNRHFHSLNHTKPIWVRFRTWMDH